MKKQAIILELTYKELDALVELAYCGNEVVNHRIRKKSIPKYDDLLGKLTREWKERTLEINPRKTEELEDVNDYISDCCMDYMIEYENARFPELLALKLTTVKGSVSKIRDFIIKSKMFN